MSEMSTEAIVASEAAANAVEELHSREEQAEQASSAEQGAMEAVEKATMAEMTATEAMFAASAAQDAAQMIGAGVADTQSVATEAAVVAEAAVDYAEQNHREISELKQMFATFLERTAPKEPESQVQEVTVNDGAESTESQNQDEEEPAEPSGEPDTGPRRLRLRRRARRA